MYELDSDRAAKTGEWREGIGRLLEADIPDELAFFFAPLFAYRSSKVTVRDGYEALKSMLPPKERRGVVLIDPLFEQEGELGRLVDGLREGVRRFFKPHAYVVVSNLRIRERLRPSSEISWSLGWRNCWLWSFTCEPPMIWTALTGMVWWFSTPRTSWLMIQGLCCLSWFAF